MSGHLPWGVHKLPEPVSHRAVPPSSQVFHVPPATSIWIERVEGGVIAAEQPPDGPPESGEPEPGYDHYVLSEVVADLAVYHALDG